MRLIAVLLIGSLSACAGTAPTRPDQVTLTARHLSDSCAVTDEHIALHVENRGATSISFSLGVTKDGPPFYLYAESFEILFRPTPESELKSWHANLDHYFPPKQRVVLHPGDATDFLISVAGWIPEDVPKTFVVRVIDDNVQPYYSNHFTLCPSLTTAKSLS